LCHSYSEKEATLSLGGLNDVSEVKFTALEAGFESSTVFFDRDINLEEESDVATVDK